MSLSIVITVYDDWNNINDIISMSLCTSMPPFTFSVFGRRCKMTITDSCLLLLFIGPESDHWLPLSLTHSLPNWLTNCCLVDLMALNDANCLMMSQQLLKAVKSFFDAWLRFMKFNLCRDFEGRHGQDLDVWKFPRNADAWLRFWSWCLVEIMKMIWPRFVLELVIWPKEVTLVKTELNPRVCCGLAMFCFM